jgi:hypothetical protein
MASGDVDVIGSSPLPASLGADVAGLGAETEDDEIALGDAGRSSQAAQQQTAKRTGRYLITGRFLIRSTREERNYTMSDGDSGCTIAPSWDG